MTPSRAGTDDQASVPARARRYGDYFALKPNQINGPRDLILEEYERAACSQ